MYQAPSGKAAQQLYVAQRSNVVSEMQNGGKFCSCFGGWFCTSNNVLVHLLTRDAGCEGSCAGPTKEVESRNSQAHRATATSAPLMATGPGVDSRKTRR